MRAGPLSLPEGFEYRPGFLDPGSATTLFTLLLNQVEWQQREIVLFGRPVMQPRLIAWFADEDVSYSYSGLTLEPVAWPESLRLLRVRLEKELETSLNSVLLNQYRHGQDSMGWHADDEPELGTTPVIASISLGAERILRIRPKAGGPSTGINLESGSLLLMSGDSQSRYQHSIPKTRREIGGRINLTFRRVY